MKQNNKGFAITSIVYSILVLFLALALLILNNMSVRQNIFEKQKLDILKKLEEPVIRYYYWGSGSISDGLPSDVSESALSGENVYLAFDSANGKDIDAAYVCFTTEASEKPYCIKGGDRGAAFSDNKGILYGAFQGDCNGNDDDYICEGGNLHANARPDGEVHASDNDAYCYVSDDGSDFGCGRY